MSDNNIFVKSVKYELHPSTDDNKRLDVILNNCVKLTNLTLEYYFNGKMMFNVACDDKNINMLDEYFTYSVEMESKLSATPDELKKNKINCLIRYISTEEYKKSQEYANLIEDSKKDSNDLFLSKYAELIYNLIIENNRWRAPSKKDEYSISFVMARITKINGLEINANIIQKIAPDFAKKMENSIFYKNDRIIKEGDYNWKVIKKIKEGSPSEKILTLPIKKVKKFPRFKSIRDANSFTCTRKGNSTVDLINSKIEIPLTRGDKIPLVIPFYNDRQIYDLKHLGTNKPSKNDQFAQRNDQVTITRDSTNRYWLIMTYNISKIDINYPIDIASTIGVHFSSKEGVTSSNGINFDEFKGTCDQDILAITSAKENYKKLAKRIIKINKKIARKRKFRLANKIEDCKYNNLHKLFELRKLLYSRMATCKESVIKKYIAALCEDLNTYTIVITNADLRERVVKNPDKDKKYKNKKARNINKKLADRSCGIIRTAIINTMKSLNKNLIYIDSKYKISTKCVACGAINKIEINEHNWTCECGVANNKQRSASINLQESIFDLNVKKCILGASSGNAAISKFGEYKLEVTKLIKEPI